MGAVAFEEMRAKTEDRRRKGKRIGRTRQTLCVVTVAHSVSQILVQSAVREVDLERGGGMVSMLYKQSTCLRID